jgi:chromosome segregation ATPase
LFLLVPITGAQETEVAENQEISEERIAAEKERLENKIAELEEQPLEYFGSQKNKRTRIGFYKYRLETLEQDPEKYFAEPEEYQGNIKTPEED